MEWTMQDILDEFGIVGTIEDVPVHELSGEKKAKLAELLDKIAQRNPETGKLFGDAEDDLIGFVWEHSGLSDMDETPSVLALPDGRQVLAKGVIVSVMYCDAAVFDKDGNLVRQLTWDSEAWG